MPNFDWRQFLALRRPTEKKTPEEATGIQRFHDVWSALEANAWNLLRHSEVIEPTLVEEDGERAGTPRLRFWDNNLSVRPTCWTLFEPPGHPVVWIVREALWEESKDNHDVWGLVHLSQTGHVPPPTMHVRDAWVPGKDLMVLLKEANNFSMPLLCRKPRETGADHARSRGLEFLSPDEAPAQVRLEWSDFTPPEWQPVLQWLERLKAFVLRCLGHPKCKIEREQPETAVIE